MSAGQSPRQVQTVARCFASSDWEKPYHSYWNIWPTAWHRSPTAWATHCHRTIINTLCWHLRNNLRQDMRRQTLRLLRAFYFCLLSSRAGGEAKQRDSLPWWVSCTASWVHLGISYCVFHHFNHSLCSFFFVFPWQIRIFKLHFMTRINADKSLLLCGVWRWAFFRDFKR